MAGGTGTLSVGVSLTLPIGDGSSPRPVEISPTREPRLSPVLQARHRYVMLRQRAACFALEPLPLTSCDV